MIAPAIFDGKIAITASQRLVSAFRNGHEIKIYDNGYGPLWIHRDSMGISGIVRAQSFEDAYEICEDEFFPETDRTWDDLVSEYGKIRTSVKMIKPLDGGPEREAVPEDYPLQPGQFVRWETTETVPVNGEEAEAAVFENALFQEAYGIRPNGGQIYRKDLNGDYLEELTAQLIASLEITLVIENE